MKEYTYTNKGDLMADMRTELSTLRAENEWLTKTVENCRHDFRITLKRAVKAEAEIERLGRELNLAKYGEPDFSWSIHKEAMSDLLARAVKAEAERDEARAQVAMAFEAAAQVVQEQEQLVDDDPLMDGSEGFVLCEVSRKIRALTPADAKAALEVYGLEKVREGMQRSADICDRNDGSQDE